MPWPYTFSVLGRLYCTITLSGDVNALPAQFRSNFISEVATRFNVSREQLGILGITAGSLLVMFQLSYNHPVNGTITAHNRTFFSGAFPLNGTLFGNYTILAKSSHWDLAQLQPPIPIAPPATIGDYGDEARP